MLIRDTTFEERFSLRLTPLNVIVVFTASFLILGAFYVSLILFTPLKEYIPGYSDGAVRTSVIQSAMKADSLEEELAALNKYQNNLAMVLQGKLPLDSVNLVRSKKNFEALDFNKSEEDSLLRMRVEEQEAYSLSNAAGGRKLADDSYFFPPLRGVITSKFNSGISHYGIDIVASAGEAVKCVQEGTVTVASWTSDGGYVIQVQHPNNLISIYKHNSVLLKSVGDKVATGDPIAIIGNTGELSTGPHLHLELWKNGRPVDPEKNIVFK